MKKRILLIGNSNGLPGVQVDFKNYISYFKSDIGGNWIDSEIVSKMNPSKSDLITTIQQLKSYSLDFAIVLFSGHGGQERETVLELNRNGETVNESDLRNISSKQITIFDCCRAFSEPIQDSRMYESFKAFSASNNRERYESRIAQAIPQQISLFACSIGEVSNDTKDGGAYSKNLIKAAKSINSSYVLVGDAHQHASTLTTSEFRDQHPDSILPRCLSNQQLIIGIN